MPSSPEVKYRRRREATAQAGAVLEAYKLAAGCLDCGFSAHPAALHFDHRDPSTKLKELGWYSDRSLVFNKTRLARFLAHVEKYCDVRCANCHSIRTAQSGQYTFRRAAPCL